MSLYNTFRNFKFTDIWNNEDDFLADYKNSGIYENNTTNRVADADIKLLFYLLFAKYGNSTIASSDTTRFKYDLFTIIFQYGPSWVKRLDIQSKLRALTDGELVTGSKAIYNHAYNPGTAPATTSLTELSAINEQNTTNYLKSKLEAYSELNALINTDVTEQFLGKFRKLFIRILAPEVPLLYCEED